MRPNTSPLADAERLAVKHAEQILQQRVLELRVILGKLIEQWREVVLDGVHRVHERRTEVRAFGQCQQCVVARLFRQHQRAALLEIGGGERPLGHLTSGLIGFDLAQGVIVTIRGVPQEDASQHRHTVFARRQLGVGAEIVCRIPEIGFEMRDVGEL